MVFGLPCRYCLPNGKSHRWVEKEFCMSHEGASDRQQCCDLTQGELDTAHNETDHSIAQECT